VLGRGERSAGAQPLAQGGAAGQPTDRGGQGGRLRRDQTAVATRVDQLAARAAVDDQYREAADLRLEDALAERIVSVAEREQVTAGVELGQRLAVGAVGDRDGAPEPPAQGRLGAARPATIRCSRASWSWAMRNASTIRSSPALGSSAPA
jgi:hypothetical protein